jgi:hypothetical protein
MSVFQYLQLQPVDPQDDGSVSDLDEYEHDDVIDLSEESEGEEIIEAWEQLEHEMHETVSSR